MKKFTLIVAALIAVAFAGTSAVHAIGLGDLKKIDVNKAVSGTKQIIEASRRRKNITSDARSRRTSFPAIRSSRIPRRPRISMKWVSRSRALQISPTPTAGITSPW